MPTEQPEHRIRTVAAVLGKYEIQYAVNHRNNSSVIVRNHSKHLVKALGNMLLPDVTPNRIVEYMDQRLKGGASNRTINLELMVLSRAIGYTWRALWPKIKKLEENQDIGRALEPDEEKRLLAAAAENPSKLIYPFLMVLTWTGMRSDEARTLRWRQVDFDASEVIIGKAKIEAGSRRVIPMSAALKMALQRHAAFCARELGPLQLEWYVFPRSNRTRPIDPTQPVTSLKTAWETVRDKAGVRCRFHDSAALLLHQTGGGRRAREHVPERMMLDMMGHVSPAMLRRYSHIRAQSRRKAIAALEGQVSLGVPKNPPKSITLRKCGLR